MSCHRRPFQLPPRDPHTVEIDEWIELASIHDLPVTDIDTSPAMRPRPLAYLLWKDNVECVLNVEEVCD